MLYKSQALAKGVCKLSLDYNIVSLSKSKNFADDNFIVTQIVENIPGKVENADCHFLLFPKCFENGSFQ